MELIVTSAVVLCSLIAFLYIINMLFCYFVRSWSRFRDLFQICNINNQL